MTSSIVAEPRKIIGSDQLGILVDAVSVLPKLSSSFGRVTVKLSMIISFPTIGSSQRQRKVSHASYITVEKKRIVYSLQYYSSICHVLPTKVDSSRHRCFSRLLLASSTWGAWNLLLYDLVSTMCCRSMEHLVLKRESLKWIVAHWRGSKTWMSLFKLER